MKVAVYGTLRRGGGLHHSYMRKAKFMGKEVLRGYKMYSLGQYPYVIVGDGDITVEIYDVKPQLYDRLESMESRVGYDVATVNTMFGEAAIFYMSPLMHERLQQRVFNGDWLQYVAEMEKQRYDYGH
jgi:gamma-glutamylcyclotransferase (GGCT)/AIG2-like uncharacterized protein YtfP